MIRYDLEGTWIQDIGSSGERSDAMNDSRLAIPTASAGLAQAIDALARPVAFPDADPTEAIQVIQTHASVVFVVGQRVYKLKKPADLGFADYSPPEARRHFCQEEIRLNARLAPHVYLGIAPVVASPDGALRFGATVPADAAPLPGATWNGGTVVDYAVVMLRCPEEAALAARVRAGTVTPAQIAAIARRVAAFHARAASDERVAAFGDLAIIAANWEENLVQMLPFVDAGAQPVLDRATYQRIASFARSFLEQRAALFHERQNTGCTRECHGDLRLEHVYLLDAPDAEDAVTIIDCVEFSERYRCGDTCGEVAFLAMELDVAGRPDLSRAFVEAYSAAASDAGVKELLTFYQCYRACVRGKVRAMASRQPEESSLERERSQREAETLFAFADQYAKAATQPLLVMIGGLVGTGKSTLAAALHREQGWPIASSDVVRKRLAGLDIAQQVPAAFGQGIYSAIWSARVYDALRAEALAALQRGHSVIVDASFIRRSDRVAVANAAQSAGARAIFLECTCPPDVARDRLRRRWLEHATGLPEASSASAASDGRPEIVDAQRAAQEAVQPDQEPFDVAATIETTLPLARQIETACEALDLPRLACWLVFPARAPER
jgi:aminoglycoside phosphotransferase family enzyme/predicted kinase